MNAGLALPAGSQLTQFEIREFTHGGSCNEELPVVVWAIRIPGKTPCPNGGPCFNLHRETDDYIVTSKKPGFAPSVCLCMGGFIE